MQPDFPTVGTRDTLCRWEKKDLRKLHSLSIDFHRYSEEESRLFVEFSFPAIKEELFIPIASFSLAITWVSNHYVWITVDQR